MKAEILPTHTPALFAVAVARAAELMSRGEIAALPTETVYGLAGNALDPAAVGRIYAAKGRPASNPVIIHVGSLELAIRSAGRWPVLAERLAAAFWPGPLTLVVPRGDGIPDCVTAGGPTVGIRWPIHPFVPAVVRACGLPLAAPSANLSNRLSPTSAEHVFRQLGDRIPLIVDGGDCNVGIESTVVDVSGAEPVILRPGMIHSEAIRAAAAGDAVVAGPTVPGADRGPARSPGQLPVHYAPKARLRCLSWRDEPDLAQQAASLGVNPSRTWLVAYNTIPMSGRWAWVSVIPEDPEAYARGLYGELHRADDAGAEWILVEALPPTPEWAGIADRLLRASSR
jgi:L-threonylcarbamoyladenylate synthase